MQHDLSPRSPVVVGVSDRSRWRELVDFAAAEAASRGVPLRVVHSYVWPLFYASLAAAPYPPDATDPTAETRALVAAAVDRARTAQPSLNVSSVITAGGAGPVLIEASRTASLVVIGSGEAPPGISVVAGGTVGHLSTHAACPTVVVPTPGGRPPGRHVVVGFDGGSGSLRALRFGADWAQRHRQPLRAVYAIPDFDAEVLGEDAALRERRDIEMGLWGRMGEVIRAFPAVDMTVVLATGLLPAQALLREGQTASLVVVGSRGHGELAGLVLGSVGLYLVHHAPGPVAVVPANRPATPGEANDARPSVSRPVPRPGYAAPGQA